MMHVDIALPANAAQASEATSIRATHWVAERVLHLQGLLAPAEQSQLLDLLQQLRTACSRVVSTSRADCANEHSPDTCLDIWWTSDVLSRDPYSYELLRTLVRRASSLASHLEPAVSSEYNPIYQECYLYPAPGGRLKAHVDCILGWIVIFSLGCDARFFFRAPKPRAASSSSPAFGCAPLFSELSSSENGLGERRLVHLRSGDVMVFNGSLAAGIVHGIEEVMPGTCPPHLAGSCLSSARIALQFRQAPDNSSLAS
jgi:alkylated DNA repair dioxygenase AlkB